jgi:predicted nucleic acid-binding protein
MTSQVCIDAGIVLKLVLDEPDSAIADELWRSWLVNDVQPSAPSLIRFEITAVLRKHVYRGVLSDAAGAEALQKALALNVELVTVPNIHHRAWMIAKRFNSPTAYDAHYLALAEWLGCEFWTADARLYNVVQSQLTWVRRLGTNASSTANP